jgi:rhamnose utilization protein RhaD (predicted bifunctional aldolase and dehydrogenase)
LGNHGLCTFGIGSEEAFATTKMAVKAARVRIGAISAGGIAFVPGDMAEKIAFRPDEVKRRADLVADKTK